MKIHEYQARTLFEKAGIAVPPGRTVLSEADAAEAFRSLGKPTAIAKVQVHMGGRGKAGGVKRVSSGDEAAAFARQFLNKPFSTTQSAGETKIIRAILFTEDRKILEEYYLGAVVDRGLGKPVLLVSREGGMEIEEVAAKNPSAIFKIPFTPASLPSPSELLPKISQAFPDHIIASQIADIAARIAKLFVEKDAAIVEVNPLALCDGGQVLALDAKIVLDDNALFRHDDLAALKDPEEDDERERKAKAFGLNYISMKGNVGCLVNGAGLAMATMDMIKLAGGEPANFLDVGGGATQDQVREGFKIILQDDRVSAILVNIFGGIMKCDVIAEGVIAASKEISLQVPLVVRLEGTRVEEGRALLRQSGLAIHSCTTIREASETAVRLAREYSLSHAHTR